MAIAAGSAEVAAEVKLVEHAQQAVKVAVDREAMVLQVYMFIMVEMLLTQQVAVVVVLQVLVVTATLVLKVATAVTEQFY